MLNVLIAGVGGQGSVLAAKVLAQAAFDKGWTVRTAETIGMAQRGGSVVSHVRMGNAGEDAFAPLVPRGKADCIVALEPGEGLRALPFLALGGLMVTATTPLRSVVSDLSGASYDPPAVLAFLKENAAHFAQVDDDALCAAVGTRKVLNTVMLAAAVRASDVQGCGLAGAVGPDDLAQALRCCVKPQFIDVNIRAAETAAVLE